MKYLLKDIHLFMNENVKKAIHLTIARVQDGNTRCVNFIPADCINK